MDGKNGGWMRRLIRMFGEHELRARLARHGKMILRERHVAREIRPPMPGAALHFPKQITCAENRPASAVVIAVVRDVEFSTGRKGEAVGIAKAPRDELRATAARCDAHHCARRRNFSAD